MTCPPADAPLYARKDQALTFTASKVASYHCTADSIEVNPFSGADADWVSGLLIATALPAVLWMQNRFMLHAAAVVPKGSTRAVAIAGASGSGKTVLAKQLLDQGANLLADDSVALEPSGAVIVASGLPGGYHHSVEGDAERCFETLPAARSVKNAPLAAIIVLGGFADRFEAQSLNKMKALETIIACQHRPRIPTALGISAHMLAQAAEVAGSIPVSIWRRCKDGRVLSAAEREALSALLE